MRQFLAAAACAALMCAGPGGAAAATKPSKASKPAKAEPVDTRIWSIARADDAYALRFGQPKEADPVFSATCLPSAQLLQIAVEVPQDNKIRSGDGVPLSLSSGKRRLELAASAFLGTTDGRLVVEAAVTLTPRVLDIFREGDTLAVRMPGSSQTYPLAGARTRLADFERACEGKR